MPPNFEQIYLIISSGCQLPFTMAIVPFPFAVGTHRSPIFSVGAREDTSLFSGFPSMSSTASSASAGASAGAPQVSSRHAWVSFPFLFLLHVKYSLQSAQKIPGSTPDFQVLHFSSFSNINQTWLPCSYQYQFSFLAQHYQAAKANNMLEESWYALSKSWYWW